MISTRPTYWAHNSIDEYISLKLNGKPLFLSTSVKYLGIHLDNTHSWKTQTEILCAKLRKTNGLISKLRHFAPKSVLLQFYFAFFDSQLRYACQVWGQNSCIRIFKLQKQCIRLITFSRVNSPSSPLFFNLKILKLSDLIKLLNIILTYNVLCNFAPSALINIYNLRKYPDSHITRGRSIGLLSRPLCKTTKFGLKSVVYQSVIQSNDFQLLYPGSDLTSMSKSKLTALYKSIILNSYWIITKYFLILLDWK